MYIYNHSTHVNGRSSVIHIVHWPLGTLPIPTEWNNAGIGLPVYAWDFRVATFHFPNPGRGSGTVPPADGRPGVSPPKNFWNSVCDLVHFDAIWWPPDPVLCNFAMKIEPISQLQCSHSRTAVLPLLSNEHALKSGTFGVPGTVLPGRGTTRHKSGTSREIRDG